MAKKARGRPPKNPTGTKDGRMEVRASAAEKERWQKAASKAGQERSDWVRAVLNDAADAALGKKSH